jgi:hypothetical protein
VRTHDHPDRQRHRANVAATRRSPEAMARRWGCEIAETPAEPAAVAGTRDKDSGKVIDPMSVAAWCCRSHRPRWPCNTRSKSPLGHRRAASTTTEGRPARLPAALKDRIVGC